MLQGNTGVAKGSRSRVPILVAILLCLLIIASRLPLLPLGFGVDDDAWYMAAAADRLATSGEYTMSRVPGYPTAELWYAAALWTFGASPAVGNGAATVAGLLAVLALALTLREAPAWVMLLGAGALAFHPAFWIASATTLDFAVSAAAITALVLALFRNAPVFAGILLGLATGARITNGLVWFPAVVYLGIGLRDRRGATMFTLVGATVSLALLALPFSRAGLAFLGYAPALHRDYVIGLYKVFREMVGGPVLLVTVFLMLRGASRRRSERRPAPADKPARTTPRILLVAGMAVVLIVPFILLPTDPYYLLGLVPLVIILLVLLSEEGRIRRSSVAWILTAMAMLSMVSIGEVDVEAWRHEHRIRLHAILAGRVLQDRVERMEILRRAARVASAVLPSHSIVILGRPFSPWLYARGTPLPELKTETIMLHSTDTLVVRILRPELLERERGRHVYYAAGEDLPYLTRRILGYSLADIGATRLVLW